MSRHTASTKTPAPAPRDSSGNHRDATITAPVVNVVTPQGLTGYWEAPYLFRRNGLYYLAYARGNPQTGGNPATIDYATSATPLGPWTYRGRILDTVTNTTTNHAAIVQFNGQWYAVYHNGALPGGGEFRRSVSVDKLYFNDDGTIQKVQQTLSPEFLQPTYAVALREHHQRHRRRAARRRPGAPHRSVDARGDHQVGARRAALHQRRAGRPEHEHEPLPGAARQRGQQLDRALAERRRPVLLRADEGLPHLPARARRRRGQAARHDVDDHAGRRERDGAGAALAHAGCLTTASLAGHLSNAASTITFRQHIGTSDALRTGSYSKTLTFTLSTTSP